MSGLIDLQTFVTSGSKNVKANFTAQALGAQWGDSGSSLGTLQDLNADGSVAGGGPVKTFRQAATQIVVADVSMSLDNVLAVAGAAKDHPTILVIGLVLSIALMGLAATYVARLLNKHRWIAYLGLAIILYVALQMMWEGWHEVQPVIMGFAF